jgi:hypothetical protein
VVNSSTTQEHLKFETNDNVQQVAVENQHKYINKNVRHPCLAAQFISLSTKFEAISSKSVQ